MENIYSIIDVGTNNVQLLIAEKKGNEIEIVRRNSYTSALGKGMKNGFLTNRGIENTKIILEEIIQISKKITDRIIIIGTSCSRDAKNISLLSDWIISRFHIRYNIISGEQEAVLNGLANTNEFPGFWEKILFDVGGGSTEFTFLKKSEIIDCTSLELGIRRLHNQFRDNKNERLLFTKEKLESVNKNIFQNPVLIGIGGTVTSLSAIKNKLKVYDSIIVHKSKISRKDLTDMINNFHQMSEQELSNIMPFEPARHEIIQTGAMIIKEIIDYFQVDNFFVSDRGLQFGILEQNEEDLGKIMFKFPKLY